MQRDETIGRAAGPVAGHDGEMVDDEFTARDALPIQPGREGRLDDLPVIADPADAADARRRQRRLGDQKLCDAMAVENFTGHRYERFEEELAAYGISVLRGWMHSGTIFKAVADLGFNLKPTEYELEELVRDSDLREELASMTVAVTLPKFRERALVGGGWTVDGGASLPTYFIGATLYVFPNEFRKYRDYRRSHTRAARELAVKPPPTVDALSDPAASVPGGLYVRDVIRDLDEGIAPVVALHLYGYSHDEIAESLGLASARAVEAKLYRWRTKIKNAERVKSAERGDTGE